jgi:phage terminase large subunit-like protein
MNMHKWDALADPALRVEDFAGEDCYSGSTSRVAPILRRVDVFRRYLTKSESGEGDKAVAHYYAFCRAYQNREKVDDPANAHLAGWEAEGFLTVTPGNVTDYNWIADDLVEDADRFHVIRVPHDPDHAAALIQFIQARDDWNQNVEFIEIAQNRRNFSPAMKETEALVLEGRLHHDGDPLFAWAIANVVAENARPRQHLPHERSGRKQDRSRGRA